MSAAHSCARSCAQPAARAVNARWGGASWPSGLIGGIAIGSTGEAGTPFADLKLVAGDDFNSMPTRWGAKTLTGKYSTSRMHGPNRRQASTGSGDVAIFIDPAYRGARSESPVALGYDGVSVSNGIATLTASPVPAELLQYLPTNFGGYGDEDGHPFLISGALKTAPHMMLSVKSDWAIVVKCKTTAGDLDGYWPSFWCASVNWPDYGEVDLVEAKKNGSQTTTLRNVIISATDGGSAVNYTVSTHNIQDDKYVTYVARKDGSNIKFYDDATAEGTLALRGTASTDIDRFRGAHDIRIDLAVSSTWDSSAFNIADWPADFKIDYWQAWTPAAAGNNSSTQVLAAVNTTPGGSWAAALPAAAVISGGADGLEQIYGVFDGEDSPGWPTVANRLPGGMSVNSGTREVTGTVPTTEGGRTCLMITFAYDDGTPAKRVLLPFNVAPAVQSSLFANQTVELDGSVSLTVEYTDFHSGNLGPHTYAVTSDKTWLTMTGNGTEEVSISGTAPSSTETATLTISCTNSIGQTTTVTRTVAAQEAAMWTPADWSTLVERFDASVNSTVFSDEAGATQAVADSSDVGRITGLVGSAYMSESTQKPTYITDALNSMKCIKFDSSVPEHLSSQSTALCAVADGTDVGWVVVFAARRGSLDGVNSRRMLGWTNSTADDWCSLLLRPNGKPGLQRAVNAVSTTTAEQASSLVDSDEWNVFTYVYSGTALSVWVDGELELESAECDTAAISINRFVIGANFFKWGSSWLYGHNGAIGEILVSSDTTRTSDVVSAEQYLMGKWLP